MSLGGIEYGDVEWGFILGGGGGSIEHGDEPSSSIKAWNLLQRP